MSEPYVEHRLRVSGNKLQGTALRRKREITEEWGKLHNKLRKSYFSQIKINLVKWKSMR